MTFFAKQIQFSQTFVSLVLLLTTSCIKSGGARLSDPASLQIEKGETAPRQTSKSLQSYIKAFPPSPSGRRSITPGQAGSKILPTIPGLLLATTMGFRGQKKIRVCVSHYNQKVNSKHFLLDMKIALATWLHHAGANSNHWKFFKFENRSTCPATGNEYQVRLVWESIQGQVGEKFVPKTMRKTIQGNRALLRSDAIKGGMGGGGTIKIRSVTRGSKTTDEYLLMAPSSLRLNPHFRFESLRNTLETWPGTSGAKKALTRAYDKLLNQTKASFSDLLSMEKMLRKFRVGSTGTDFAAAKQRQRLLSKKPLKSVTYNPIYGYYNVVLHEIGHQMGLLHNQSRDSVMHKNGDLYFLTGNDIKAIQKVWQEAVKVFKEKNPPRSPASKT